MTSGDAVPKTLLEVKRRISDALLDAGGVSGVGLRGESVVVYLETGDKAVRQRIEENGGQAGAQGVDPVRSDRPVRETVVVQRRTKVLRHRR
jgi:hypothetical protein